MTEFVALGIFLALAMHTVLGGADFGAGCWQIATRHGEAGRAERELIARSMGPVWEANHVWLILAMVFLWTGFPRAFAPIASGLWPAFGVAGIGVILRGAAFAFRHASHHDTEQRWHGHMFAWSSPLAPFALGAVAGCVAAARVPGLVPLGPVEALCHPLPLLSGSFALLLALHIAAVFLVHDAEAAAAPELALRFRRRGLVTALLLGGVAALAFPLFAQAAPSFHARLIERALPVYLGASLAGLATIALLFSRRAALARWTSALMSGILVLGWGLAHIPEVVPGQLTLADAAASAGTVRVLAYVLVFAFLLLAPALWLLFRTFRSGGTRRTS
jgi:cytochrome d ubiquinol oxidase subunit II